MKVTQPLFIVIGWLTAQHVRPDVAALEHGRSATARDGLLQGHDGKDRQRLEVRKANGASRT